MLFSTRLSQIALETGASARVVRDFAASNATRAGASATPGAAPEWVQNAGAGGGTGSGLVARPRRRFGMRFADFN